MMHLLVKERRFDDKSFPPHLQCQCSAALQKCSVFDASRYTLTATHNLQFISRDSIALNFSVNGRTSHSEALRHTADIASILTEQGFDFHLLRLL